MVQIQQESSNASYSTTSSRSGSKACSLADKLRETLQDELRFAPFIDWMYREFSSEVMLSVIEFSQFQDYLKTIAGTVDSIGVMATNETLGKGIVFFDTMPRSSILRREMPSEDVEHETDAKRNNQKDEHVRRSARALYEKYIRRHCELEINISSILRTRWDLMDCRNYPRKDWTELGNMTDEVVKEMMKYIRQSFLRFDFQQGSKGKERNQTLNVI